MTGPPVQGGPVFHVELASALRRPFRLATIEPISWSNQSPDPAMHRIQTAFLLALLSSTAPLAAQEQADRVQEILDHLDTFMPVRTEAPAQVAPYVIAPIAPAPAPAMQAATTRMPGPIEVKPLPPAGAMAGLDAEPVSLLASGQGDEDLSPPASGLTHAPTAPALDQPSTAVGGAVGEAVEDAKKIVAPELLRQLDDIDFEGLSRDAMLVPLIGADLSQVARPFQGDALHQMARVSILAGNPSAFRKIMAAYIDPAWSDLGEVETAYNIIAWMPDTAAFLDARIAAARYLGGREDVSRKDLEFLWKELRARVERVGRAEMMRDTLAGMLESGFAELAIQTVQRNTASSHERITLYVSLIDDAATRMPAEALARMVAEIEGLRGDISATRYDPNAIARAYWRAGLTEKATAALEEELDPALRLRTRFEMLLSRP